MPKLYIISGCNGAGKTTASNTILPDILNCKEFVNADYIASGLSPYQPEAAAIAAGRIMLNRINNLIHSQVDFALETTLSSKTLVNTIELAKSENYEVILLYFWLSSVELAIDRIAERVKKGGHNIGDDIVERRYYRGLKNLFEIIIPIVDRFIIFNNSGKKPTKIAETDEFGNKTIYNFETFNRMMEFYHDK